MTQPGVRYEFKEHLIERQAKNETAMLKEFHDGNYTMEEPLIKYNPYIVNELSAVILFKTEEPTAITLRVVGKTEKADQIQSFPVNTEHVLPVVGLYSDYENKVEIYPWQKPHLKVTHTIKTPAVHGQALVERMETTAEYLQDQVMLLCPATSALGFAVDFAGDARLNFAEALLWDCKKLENGNYMMASERVTKMPYFMSGLYEFSPVGKIYKEYRVPHGYHHDFHFNAEGDILALNCNAENGTVEDRMAIIDRDTGHIKHSMNFIDFLDPGAQKSGSWSDQDWFHCNAVWFDENTNSVTLSGRHINAMVNVDIDTHEMNWIISDPDRWPEKYQKYMFTPVGDGEFDWQYEQHSNLITPNGDVMCFDNHHYGSQDPDKYLAAKDNFSRTVKYRIDTDTMEIEQLWQYGKERGAEFFSPYICNSIFYKEGHYLTHSGGIAYDQDGNPSEKLGAFYKEAERKNGAQLKSITVETLHDNKMLELEVNDNYYRANKIDLYNREGGNDLVLGRGVILGNLGETPQMETSIPSEETGELLPPFHEGHLVDEEDMFTFFAKFEKGDLVMLLLENEEETRQYYVSTAGNARGAMCAGTFLSTDDRDTRTIISKEGLAGKYDVKVVLGDKKYDTGVTIKA